MKIFFSHSFHRKNKYGKPRVNGLTVEAGYTCSHSCDCKYGNTCKYRGKWNFHNMLVEIHRFVNYKLKWESFRIPFYFQSHYSDLSGTVRCPNQVPRAKDCYRCTYCRGERCINTDRTRLLRSGKYDYTKDPHDNACQFFEPDTWFDRYDRETGDVLFD